MADKKFGVKQLNLIGASGTPVITSPNTLNINATNVAISTDMTIGGTVNSNITVGTGYTFYGDGSGLTGTAPSRVIVSGATTSIVNSGIGNTDITGFKSYMLMRVGLSTAGWFRLYTDSASRANDTNRSVGEDPLPGSGVIAEVVATGLSTNHIISPFVPGGNLDDPASTTMYVAITNTSGTTQSITANLTILQLED
ncbi:MAG: hypothetical protein CM15mV1_1510 [uncultured marine virus]|jgi:hypothetical protein|nr:MAG: hypothetical protein CM15mV1_1510 [uncultured marine virus]|tara:strand:+ start:256 stop:846 length:591 start_codon:yes stop_codon:yes gene_type:complete